MANHTEALTISAEDDGARLDRVLAARIPALSRSRLKALILGGEVTIDGRTIRDPSERVKSGAKDRRDAAGAGARQAGGREHPAQHRLRGRRPHRHRQAGRSRRASCRGPCVRNTGQCADRALRRQPLGHRRRQAARHRAPARQGHDRPDGRRQERPRPQGAVGAVRQQGRRRPPRARLPRFRLGRSAAATRHDRRSARPASRRPRQARGARQAAARRSPIGSCWRPMPARTAKTRTCRSRACSTAGWKRAARTKSASTSPISAIRCSATRPMPPAIAPSRRG